jgi:hypothetical protein
MRGPLFSRIGEAALLISELTGIAELTGLCPKMSEGLLMCLKKAGPNGGLDVRKLITAQCEGWSKT